MGSIPQTIQPFIRDKTVYEYALPTTGQFVSDLKLHCHPLVIDGAMPFGTPNYKLRLSVHDIESVDYISDNILLYQIKNGNQSEPVIPLINPDYSVDLDFFNDTKIITTALNPVTVRIIFWREPVTPLWLTCTVNYTTPFVDTSGVLDFTTHKYWNKMVWR